MGDMTLLANQYAVSAEFVQKLNRALLRLKKQQFGSTKGNKQDDSQVQQYRKELADLLEAVLARLEKRSYGSVAMPEEFIQRLGEAYKAQLSWRLSDLRHTVAELQAAEGISERALQTLDQVCEAAEITASTSFRRLWRR